MSNERQQFEQLLGSLQPEPLQIDRHEFFFEAGRAAAGASHRARYIWPSAVAALLLLSLGLGTALLRQSDAMQRLQAGIAPPQRPAAETLLTYQFLDDRSRSWSRLASPAQLPPGRLTALGWVDLPPNSRLDRREPSEQPDGTAAPRPATYLELMRAQQEG